MVDAGDDGELCNGNYLNEQSLQNITDASHESTGYRTFSPAQQTVHSVPINKSGNAVKLLIAARFNYSATYNSRFSQTFTCSSVSDSAHPPWPTIDIVRINGARTFPISICHEPRPSGYLNVFEYELTGNVRVGDVVRIRVPWPHLQGTSKYLLAYLNRSQPMVYIEINDTNKEPPEIMSTIPADEHTVSESPDYGSTYLSSDGGKTASPHTSVRDIEYTSMSTEPIPSSDHPGIIERTTHSEDIDTHSNGDDGDKNTDLTQAAAARINQQVALITSSLICVLVLIIAITVTVVIALVLIHRRRKNSNSFSPRSDALDNVYVHNEILPVGDQSMGNRQAESGERGGGPSASNDQQDVCELYVMLFVYYFYLGTITVFFTRLSDCPHN